jgi:hypothetical protein
VPIHDDSFIVVTSAGANFKRQRRAPAKQAAPQRFRSAEGWNEGEAGATELPSSMPPTAARNTGEPQNSCQAPKRPKSNKTKRKIGAHYIHSIRYNRYRDQNPTEIWGAHS